MRRPSNREIAAQEQYLIERQRRFRVAADLVTAALARDEAVQAVALIGSVARPLWREVPRFPEFRHHDIAVVHECKDVDLAVWISRLDGLGALRRASGRAASKVLALTGSGVAHHEVEGFLLEPGTNRYLGRLCHYARCPADKRNCRAAGCGREKFLQQHDDFVFWPDAIAEGGVLRLFDRAAG